MAYKVEAGNLIVVGEVPGEWELVHEERTGHGWWYIGRAEQCTFEFSTLPEEIPGVDWLVRKVGDAFKAEIASRGGEVLEYKIYFDAAEWYRSRWKVVITAHGSPLAWTPIIIAALVVIGIAIIAWILHDVKDTWWGGWAVIGIAGGVAALGVAGIIHAVRRKK